MSLTNNAQKIFDLVKELTAIELADLVKALEEEFGVTAAAMVVSGGAAGWDDSAAAKDSVNVELTDAGQQKIAVIKVIKELLGIDLKAAKDLVEKAPVVIKEGVKQDEGEILQAKLQEAGATVNLK